MYEYVLFDRQNNTQEFFLHIFLFAKKQVEHNYQHKCDVTVFIKLSPCEKVYC